MIGLWGGEIELSSSTVVANAGAWGIENISGGTLALRNTIISNDLDAFMMLECDPAANVISVGHNIDSDGTCVGTGLDDQPGVEGDRCDVGSVEYLPEPAVGLACLVGLLALGLSEWMQPRHLG